MISYLLHEMGHGFGIPSDRDTDTGLLPVKQRRDSDKLYRNNL